MAGLNCLIVLQAAEDVVDVVFAISLPEASKNSLLVVQSNNPAVTDQFAGWFGIQMAARGA